MRKKLYTQFFVFLTLIVSVFNCYATTPHLFSNFSYLKGFQENINKTYQDIDDGTTFVAFKPSINIANELFIIEEIPVEDVEEKEESLLHSIRKSVFGFHTSAILYRVLFENATLKTKEDSLYQKTFATHVALHLYQKFEVYRI
ncbi:hypothetical protein IU405_11910 [Polaribacter sp. BAL334]|uniref:hypothetical protein n=1 Tax=Polaribacter sp. BAL334 TaxID=1708178 RepID=UPI0018D2664D|nr:hypothetical protein [Polaribacter sp. BAL334]MBG7612953.1 hypothetical protein [Polaribacter sp. BAL334]